MRRDKMTFTEAVECLSFGGLAPSPRPAGLAHSIPERSSGPPAKEWQEQARQFIADCEECLWTDKGAKARQWLHSRGLSDETLRFWRIGFNDRTRRDHPQRWGLNDGKQLWLRAGVVIPCVIGEPIWYVKIRDLEGTEPGMKYLQIRGSRAALYGADTLGASNIAVITEGEFDTLITWQSLQQASDEQWRRIGVCTLGSASKSLDIERWGAYLLPVVHLFVSYDADEAGQRGAEEWERLTRRVHRISIPKIGKADKDLTDFHKSGGRILDLIAFEIARVRGQLESKCCIQAPLLERADQRVLDASWENEITFRFPPDAAIATIGGKWRRDPTTKEIIARYTRSELELCLRIVGVL